MGLYDRIKDVCNVRNISINKLEKNLGFPRSSICKYNNNNPSIDKITKIAVELNVSVDFLMGNADTIECEECGQKYNPLDEFDCAIHDRLHNNIIQARSIDHSLVPYKEIANVKSKCLIEIQKSNDFNLEILQEYLQAAYSEYVYMDYEYEKHFEYSDFCKSEIVRMIEREKIPSSWIDQVVLAYNIDKEMVNKTDLLLAKVSNNQQLMRILAYTEKLSPDILDSIEIQLKALSESHKE